jgi:hypothetical protein
LFNSLHRGACDGIVRLRHHELPVAKARSSFAASDLRREKRCLLIFLFRPCVPIGFMVPFAYLSGECKISVARQIDSASVWNNTQSLRLCVFFFSGHELLTNRIPAGIKGSEKWHKVLSSGSMTQKVLGLSNRIMDRMYSFTSPLFRVMVSSHWLKGTV